MASVGTGIDFGHAVNSKTAIPAHLTPAIELSRSGHTHLTLFGTVIQSRV